MPADSDGSGEDPGADEDEQGRFEYKTELEDIHMHIETALIRPTRRHPAASSTRAVVVTIKWQQTCDCGCVDSIDQIDHRLAELQRAFITDAKRTPTSFCRDTRISNEPNRCSPLTTGCVTAKNSNRPGQLADCRKRANVQSGRRGTGRRHLPIDREDVAARLGFEGVAANSLDVSSDRDFVLEFAFCLAVIAEHLSTWARVDFVVDDRV